MDERRGREAAAFRDFARSESARQRIPILRKEGV
jgi:hypothetical protein